MLKGESRFLINFLINRYLQLLMVQFLSLKLLENRFLGVFQQNRLKAGTPIKRQISAGFQMARQKPTQSIIQSPNNRAHRPPQAYAQSLNPQGRLGAWTGRFLLEAASRS